MVQVEWVRWECWIEDPSDPARIDVEDSYRVCESLAELRAWAADFYDCLYQPGKRIQIVVTNAAPVT